MKALLVVAVAAIGVAAAVVLLGLVEVAADAPPSSFVHWLLSTARERSVARRAGEVAVPDLTAPTRIAAGAPEYAEMCSTCHRAPGQAESELRRGLNPPPPDLTKRPASSPAHAFWVVKHGIRMTGMPAWGLTHDDERLWNVVAFLQRLPDLGEAQYAQLLQAKGAGEPPKPHGTHADSHSHAK